MEASSHSPEANPLGLNLDFLFGRGYLWARHERLSDWITLEHLRMEIPDLKFPFDARGGLNRFRNTRCLVREIEISTSEVGLGDLLRQAAADLEGFDDLEVHFLEGAIQIAVRVSAFGTDTYLSFRAALVPPEPARADQVHLSIYDYRAYGPLPYPARLLAFELMTRLLNTPVLRPPGRGQSFTVGIAGDILSFRPLKLILLHIFPRVGWKLPNLSDIVLDGARIRPGLLTIRAASTDPNWTSGEAKEAFEIGATREGARALAAYEAKDLMAHGDQALFDGQPRQALNIYATLRDRYGLHPELVGRMLDCLLADPSPANLAEAESLCRELEGRDDRDLRAHLARPAIAQLRGNRQEALDAFNRLSQLLHERGETHDWVQSELATARFLRLQQPDAAAERLREVLKVAPRNRNALENLRELYQRLGEIAGLEEVLKRLTGVYTDRESLTDTYLALARHLIDRQGEVGEARVFLERVLRLDPGQLEALDTLGESYAMSGEPLRALKAFGSAARAAESRGDRAQAGRLLARVARLWSEAIGDPDQALLSCRRALSLTEDAASTPRELLERARLFEFAGSLCRQLERMDEAIGYATDALGVLERLGDAALSPSADVPEDLAARRIALHRALADIYEERERPQAAIAHLERIVELEPADLGALTRLSDLLMQSGQAERVVSLYRSTIERNPMRPEATELRVRLGRLYGEMNLVDEARAQLVEALRVQPNLEDARIALIELMTTADRAASLREILQGLLLRIQDREARWEVLMDLGAIERAELDDPAAAAARYWEAFELIPPRFEALDQAREALDVLIDRHGLEAEVGEGQTASQLLDRVLERLVDVRADEHERLVLLERRRELAQARGDRALLETLDRLIAAADGNLSLPSPDEIDARLDALLDAHDALDEDTEPPEYEADGNEDGEDDEAFAREITKLTSFRQRLEEDIKRSHDVPLRERVKPDSPLGRILRKREDEKKAQVGLEESSVEWTKPQAEQDHGFRREHAPTTRRSSVLEELEQARRSDDPRRLADTIVSVLERADAGQFELDPQRRVELAAEAGELLYYDLEDNARALPLLEYVRDHDPDGRGAQGSILNALEAIYEEEGRVEGRITILRDRLERAQNEEMETVYRLLIAQLVWDEFRDREQVRSWLQPILARDAKHEAAHRLLADVAIDSEDWRAAARHLHTTLEVSAEGLDTVEVERMLADLLLHRLDEPERARKHFQNVLDAAPGDSQALEGVKKCQIAVNDWGGYVDSLRLELGLLLGKPGGISVEEITVLDTDHVPAVLRVPASQIVSDIAHVVETEQARLEEARLLWGKVVELWSEQVEALERKITLDRVLKAHRALAEDLETYADMLLDVNSRFEALVEAARIRAETLEEPDAARPLYTEALAMADGAAEPPEGVDEARRALARLQNR